VVGARKGEDCGLSWPQLNVRRQRRGGHVTAVVRMREEMADEEGSRNRGRTDVVDRAVRQHGLSDP